MSEKQWEIFFEEEAKNNGSETNLDEFVGWFAE